jgi:glycosyltransferase involved in cell wall biosynthesis
MPGYAVGSVRHLGVSRARDCGVRDYASGLDEAMRTEGVDSRVTWRNLGRQRSPVQGMRQDLAFAAALGAATEDVVVWHYSPFAHGARGLPIAPLIVGWLRRPCGLLVVVLHELTFPRGVNGARGWVWRKWQDACLRMLLRAAHGVMVTTNDRRALVEEFRPGVRVLERPVWNTIPRQAPLTPVPGRIGVFGWGSFTDAAQLVLTALSTVRHQHEGLEVVLLGGDPDGASALAWQKPANGSPVNEAVRFTGYLEPADLDRELASLEIFLHADLVGPTARKTTLAAALSRGLPIVAFAGSQTWAELDQSDGVLLAPTAASGLAAVLERVLTNPAHRGVLAAAGRAFYDAHADVTMTTQSLLTWMGSLVDEPAQRRGSSSKLSR